MDLKAGKNIIIPSRNKIYHATESAKKSLLSFVAKAPFPILTVQVDGGSEFMAEFEEVYAEFCIPLIVLPPKKPTYNGGVERGNIISREEVL